jgi:pyruvate dehydrogenase E1 component alpha subunit
MAQVWKLPVIFLCQNNQYAEHTSYAHGTSAKQIVDRAIGYNMHGLQADGNDPVDMYRAAKTAVDYARAGNGPTLLEAKTFRLLGHIFGSNYDYVPKEKMAAAVEADPIPAFRKRLIENQVAEADLDAIVAKIEADIDAAFAHAEASPYPDVAEIRRDVLKEELAA